MKLKIKKPKEKNKSNAQILSKDQISIRGEIDYIIGRAAASKSRMVTLGSLVFFSTETGDAWLLDPQERSSLCLAREGSPMPVQVLETEQSFSIGWDSKFAVDGELFVVTEKNGRVRTIMGYPTKQIVKAITQILF
jgi:hypothetical protein